MATGKNLIDEADIGSGEKSPGEQETQKMIEQLGKDRAAPKDNQGKEAAVPPSDPPNATAATPAQCDKQPDIASKSVP